MNQSTETILVTGASGFIGSALVKRLLEQNQVVHLTSRSAMTSNDKENLTWHQIDLTDQSAVHKLIETVQPTVVFHLASLVSGSRDASVVEPMVRDNFLSTVYLLGALEKTGVKKIILAGSMEEPMLSTDPIPSSPYAAAKIASTLYAQMYHRLYHLPVSIARLFMVYGPGQKDLKKLVPYTISSLLAHQEISFSSGKRLVDWIYVDDVVDALMTMQNAHNIAGQIVDIGSGVLTSVREIAEHIQLLIEGTKTLSFGAIEDRANEIIRMADVGATEQLLGWKAKVTLTDGLQRTIHSYVEQQKLT